MARLRGVVKEILNTGTSPARTAASVSLGIAVGLSPIVGFQTFVVILAAFVLGLNRVAALLASCIFNPWTAFPIVVLQLHAGSAVLHRPLPVYAGVAPSFDPAVLMAVVAPSLSSYVAGGLLVAACGGALSYPVVYWVACWYRRLQRSAAAPVPAAPGTPDRA